MDDIEDYQSVKDEISLLRVKAALRCRNRIKSSIDGLSCLGDDDPIKLQLQCAYPKFKYTSSCEGSLVVLASEWNHLIRID